MTRPRYRWRTALRTRLPWVLAERIRKGRGDCGEHEWYRSTEDTWRCYHCDAGETRESPWDERESAARAAEARALRLRAGVESADRA